MAGCGDFLSRISFSLGCKLVWLCLFGAAFAHIDCGQANALSYVMGKDSEEPNFCINIEEIQDDSKNSVWIESTHMAIDEDWAGWHLAPYPVHMDGALYYAFIFQDQSILVSQVQGNTSGVPSIEILPIPESSTLFLIGIGLIGIGAFIRYESIKKSGKQIYFRQMKLFSSH